jgi:hypothetical protein
VHQELRIHFVKRLNKYLVTLIGIMFFGMVLLVSFFHIAPEWRKKSDYEKTRDRLREAIERKNREIVDLRAKQRYFLSDRDFIETILHQNKRVRENETIFIFDE